MVDGEEESDYGSVSSVNQRPGEAAERGKECAGLLRWPAGWVASLDALRWPSGPARRAGCPVRLRGRWRRRQRRGRPCEAAAAVGPGTEAAAGAAAGGSWVTKAAAAAVFLTVAETQGGGGGRGGGRPPALGLGSPPWGRRLPPRGSPPSSSSRETPRTWPGPYSEHCSRRRGMRRRWRRHGQLPGGDVWSRDFCIGARLQRGLLQGEAARASQGRSLQPLPPEQGRVGGWDRGSGASPDPYRGLGPHDPTRGPP